MARREKPAKEPEKLANGLLKNAPPLPKLMRGRRRGWMLMMILLGLGQAALGALSAWALLRMNAAPVGASPLLLRSLLVLVLAALAVGALKIQERVVAERLGQDYVHQLRLTLLGDVLTPGHSTSLGVTVTRTSNDLSAVRNWVSQGIAPLAVGIPLILGTLGTLSFLSLELAGAMALPLVLLGLGMIVWSRSALIKTREMRRTRGRLSARIADTVTATDTILAAGGTRRELKNIRDASGKLVEKAVDRAETIGTIRAAGIVASTLVTLLVAAAGTYLGLDPGVTMAAMLVAGIASTPVLELGRIVEYRQTYRAARMVLGPALAQADRRRDRIREQRRAAAQVEAPDPGPDGSLLVHLELPGLTVSGNPVEAGPRERIRLVSDDPDAPHLFMRRLLELSPGPDHLFPDSVWVNGENLRALNAKRIRVLVGHAAAGSVFERGSVARALHYRRPDLDAAYDQEVLDLVGLDVSRLPGGARTTLRRGGDPLSRSDKARLALARAVYGAPPLLLIDGLEGDLDDAGRWTLERVLADYRGAVVMVCSDELAARLGAREHQLQVPVQEPEQGEALAGVGAGHDGDDDG